MELQDTNDIYLLPNSHTSKSHQRRERNSSYLLVCLLCVDVYLGVYIKPYKRGNVHFVKATRRINPSLAAMASKTYAQCHSAVTTGTHCNRDFQITFCFIYPYSFLLLPGRVIAHVLMGTRKNSFRRRKEEKPNTIQSSRRQNMMLLAKGLLFV